MKIKTALLALALIGFFSCNKSDDDSMVTMAYNQTKCADRWSTGQNSTDNETIAAVDNYFEETLQIEVHQIEISQEDTLIQFCEACICLTGRIISLNVNEENVAALQEEGFFIP